MKEDKLKTFGYLGLVSSAAAIIILTLDIDKLAGMGRTNLINIAILLLFSLILEYMTVSGGRLFISLSSVVAITVAMTYGETALIFLGVTVFLLKVRKLSNGRLQFVFNREAKNVICDIAIVTIESHAAFRAYTLFGGTTITESVVGTITLDGAARFISQNTWAIVAFIVTDLLINTILMAIWVYTQDPKFSVAELLKDMLWPFLGLFVIGIIGIFMSFLMWVYGVIAILVVFVPLMLAKKSLSMYDRIKKGYMETVKALANAIEAKDSYTRGHSQRVHDYSMLIAEELKLSNHKQEILQYAAILHDVGKIGIPETILNKPGKLESSEFDAIKKHPTTGAKIIEEVEFLAECKAIIKYHHLYFDGTGYPSDADIDNVPFESHILGVADAYDAMTSERPYRKPLSHARAMDEIHKYKGKQFNPKVVEAFDRAMNRLETNEAISELAAEA